MLALKEIKANLRDIKNYYRDKENIDKFSKEIGTSSVVDIANKYNVCICKAPLRLYQLYISLYVKSQSSLYEFSLKEGYSEGYVQKLHSSLLHYFQENLEVAA